MISRTGSVYVPSINTEIHPGTGRTTCENCHKVTSSHNLACKHCGHVRIRKADRTHCTVKPTRAYTRVASKNMGKVLTLTRRLAVHQAHCADILAQLENLAKGK